MNKDIFICQTKYIKEMLKNFEMEDSKLISTRMVIGCKISKEYESNETDQTLYISMICILLYVMDSRPDIMQVVGLIGRFQAAPKETHVQAIKRIYQILKGTLEFFLWYPTRKDFTLTSYTYVDGAGNVDDRKSTSGATFFLSNSLVSWFGKKQSTISLSTIKA
jgi:hypothetical protein